ncbi:MAG: methyltransferase family protein [bacterium]|nr:MAG: methyltransferase family protein [bacterium]KAF0147159.1 MAG: methyltransferase family protein [bacterium]KAF0165724.1 MAG: methyltransferase family protein [bacterium]
MNDDIVARRYTNGEYAENNPDWDANDSPWKAERVAELLAVHDLRPASIVEIGCGAGWVLANLKACYPGATLAGYDIAHGLPKLWEKHGDSGIHFVLGNYLEQSEAVPDLVLVLDVIEHLGNPFDFLATLSGRCRHAVFHFPLDLSAVSVLREAPLLHVRRKVGHLHFFTRGLVLALLEECGFEVIEARYTGAAYSAPNRSLRTRLAGLLRRMTNTLLGDAGVRLLGGETLMVLARPRATS